jgi:hypothetical protein
MTTSKNDITGDQLISKTATDLYREGWDRIFNKTQKSSSDSKTSDLITKEKDQELERKE